MVDEQTLEVAGEEVARDAQRQLGLLVDQRRRFAPSRALASIVSQSRQQEVEVARDVLGGGALGGGADDHAARASERSPCTIAFSRLRSSSSSRRETPRPSPCGT